MSRVIRYEIWQDEPEPTDGEVENQFRNPKFFQKYDNKIPEGADMIDVVFDVEQTGKYEVDILKASADAYAYNRGSLDKLNDRPLNISRRDLVETIDYEVIAEDFLD